MAGPPPIKSGSDIARRRLRAKTVFRAEVLDASGVWGRSYPGVVRALRRRAHLAIEVKAARTLRPADLRGLRAISELERLTRRVLVFLGSERLTTPDGIEALPLQAFSEELARGNLVAV